VVAPLHRTHTSLSIIARETGGVVWSIALSERPPTRPDAVTEANELAKQGQVEEALAFLSRAREALPEAEHAYVDRAQGGLEFGRSNHREALRHYQRAYQAAVHDGLLREASEIALTAVFTCVLLHDLTAGEQWLRKHEGLLAEYPPGRLVHSYYSGLLATGLGDLRQALVDYIAHAKFARRLGATRDLFAAHSQEGVLRGHLGDFSGASKAYRVAASVSDEVGLSFRGGLLANQGWTRIEARSRGKDVGDPLPYLNASLGIFREGGSAPDPRAAVEVRLNISLAHILNGDAGAASKSLPRSDQTSGARQAMWRELIAAEVLALRSQFVDAYNSMSKLGETTAKTGDMDLQWYAAVRRGELLRGAGRTEAAVFEFRRAEALLDEQLSRISVDAGREQFATDRARSSWGLIELLIAEGQIVEAACVARLARARTYEPLRQRYLARALSPQQRGIRQQALAHYRTTRSEVDRDYERSWSLSRREGEILRGTLGERLRDASRFVDLAYTYDGGDPIRARTCEELRRPASGELLLVYYPLESGWVGFALGGEQALVHRFDATPDDAPQHLTDKLLRPFEQVIQASKALRVVPTRELLQVNFHNLPWAGQPLIAHRRVTYSLDLPPVPPARIPSRRAVVVAPPSNLVAAIQEIEDVVDTLTQKGWETEVLSGRDATLENVRDHASNTDLLHFVGHARGDGLSGWDSALELAGGSTMRVEDILALPGPAPRMVVLNGCKTGITDPETLGGGMSLAHAFLLAGAQAVVATQTEIDDRASADWMKRLYHAFEEGASASELLQASYDVDDGTGSMYRVWVP